MLNKNNESQCKVQDDWLTPPFYVIICTEEVMYDWIQSKNKEATDFLCRFGFIPPLLITHCPFMQNPQQCLRSPCHCSLPKFSLNCKGLKHTILITNQRILGEQISSTYPTHQLNQFWCSSGIVMDHRRKCPGVGPDLEQTSCSKLFEAWSDPVAWLPKLRTCISEPKDWQLSCILEWVTRKSLITDEKSTSYTSLTLSLLVKRHLLLSCVVTHGLSDWMTILLLRSQNNNVLP